MLEANKALYQPFCHKKTGRWNILFYLYFYYWDLYDPCEGIRLATTQGQLLKMEHNLPGREHNVPGSSGGHAQSGYCPATSDYVSTHTSPCSRYTFP